MNLVNDIAQAIRVKQPVGAAQTAEVAAEVVASALDDRGLEQAEAIVHWARQESDSIYGGLGKREIEHALEALKKARELA